MKLRELGAVLPNLPELAGYFGVLGDHNDAAGFTVEPVHQVRHRTEIQAHAPDQAGPLTLFGRMADQSRWLPQDEQLAVFVKDFVQIKTGPFDVDLVFAPDGIKSFEKAKPRGLREGIFRVAPLRDIIASKRASGRQKDRVELPLLESFRAEYEKRHAPALHSSAEIAARKGRPA